MQAIQEENQADEEQQPQRPETIQEGINKTLSLFKRNISSFNTDSISYKNDINRSESRSDELRLPFIDTSGGRLSIFYNHILSISLIK